MMSLLNVTVKRASYVGDQASQLNSYVTVKLQNVKCTTVTVKGATPCWEQDFVFETTSGDVGLVVEVFSKEMLIINHPIGHKYIPLNTIPYGYPNETTSQWYTLDHELVMQNGVVVGSKNPTGHMLMLDCRFELPYDGDPSVNHIVTSLLSMTKSQTNTLQTAQKSVSVAAANNTTTISNSNIIPYHSNTDQLYHQNKYLTNKSAYSEESSFHTSEFNYPVAGQKAGQAMNNITGQKSMYNQYGVVANTTNNYMQQQPIAEYHQYNNQYNQNIRQDNSYEYSGYYDDGSGYNNGSCYNNQLVPDMNSCYPDDTLDYEQDDDLYYNSRPMKDTWSKGGRRMQTRRSLERQDTLYSEDMYNGVESYPDVYNNHYQNEDSFDQFDATNDCISEDRQWDSGGRHTSYGKRLPDPPSVRGSTSVSEGLYYSNKRGASLPATPLSQKRHATTSSGYNTLQTSTTARVLPQPAVTKSPKMLPQVPINTTISSVVNRSKRKMPVPNIMKPDIYSETDTTLNNSPYHKPDTTYLTSITQNFNEDYNYAYESSEAINDNFFDSFGNATRKSRSAALPVVPQVTSLAPAVTDSTKMFNNISNTYDIYNAMSTATTTNSMLPTTDFGYENNSSSTYLSNDNYNSKSIFGSNITTAASVHHSDEHSKVDNLFGKLSSAASALKSTVQKQLPQPTITTTSSTIGITNITSSTGSTYLQSNKLPPIPTITNSLYGIDSLTSGNIQAVETRSTNENDDSMFSRFNSYESESVPYSTSNDLSMYTSGQDVIPTTYENNGDLYGETHLGHEYGGNNEIGGGTVKEDLDGFGDSFYNEPSSTVTHNTTSRLGISDKYTLSTASAVPKTLPPIPDTASIYDTHNSNLYDDYASDNTYMNPIITTTATSTVATIASTIGTNDITNYDDTIDKLSHLNDDYPYEEQYNNQNIISNTVTTTPGLTTNHMTDSAYTSDYYDNCQYDYEYTENETDYLASGDIIEKGKQPSSNLYNNNNNIYATTTSLTSTNYTMTTGVTSYQQQQQQQRPSLEQVKQQEPNKTASILGQSKSLLGGLSNMIGSSVTNLISKSSELTKPASTATATTPSNTTSLGFGSTSAFGISNQYNNSTLPSTTSSSLFGTSIMTTTTSSTSNTYGYHDISSTINNHTPTVSTTVDSMMNSTTSDYNNSLYDSSGMMIDNVHNLVDHQQPEILEPYREDFEDEFQKHDEMVNNQLNLDDAYSNGYYDENQVGGSQHMMKPGEEQFYNTYNDYMVFNEEDEDQYHEQEKLEEQLEEYKEDYEEDFIPSSSKPMTTIDNTSVTTSQAYTNHTVNSTLNNQRSLPQQDSFDELEYESKLNKNSRMLQKQDTILSEAAEYIEDHEMQHEKQTHHLQQQESLLPGEEPEHNEHDLYAEEQNQHIMEKQSGIEMIHEEPPPRKDSIEPIPTVLKEKPKPKPTAKERWHWAYNKIIMQLNVSPNLILCFPTSLT